MWYLPGPGVYLLPGVRLYAPCPLPFTSAGEEKKRARGDEWLRVDSEDDEKKNIV